MHAAAGRPSSTAPTQYGYTPQPAWPATANLDEVSTIVGDEDDEDEDEASFNKGGGRSSMVSAI